MTPQATGFRVLAHEDPELEWAWLQLERWSVYTHGGAKAQSQCSCAFPHRCATGPDGESWQYMGTTDEAHEFRHRNWPLVGRRVYLHIPRQAAIGAQLRVRYC